MSTRSVLYLNLCTWLLYIRLTTNPPCTQLLVVLAVRDVITLNSRQVRIEPQRPSDVAAGGATGLARIEWVTLA